MHHSTTIPRGAAANRLEIWGGAECSVVRLADRVENELRRTGHDQRLDDLDRIAELGIRTIRFPLLWELHAAAEPDWSWADLRLERLRQLGIRPIVGLLHHGGGPLPEGFLDPGFVDGLAHFARRIAHRYPWVDAYTPVNEPLTTARFSGMYDLWHPHGRSVGCFTNCYLQQCRGIRAAMQAIREINPAAQLVQTEDLGKTHSTPHLEYQAQFENERRWVTFDLLRGELTRDRAMWHYLVAGGIPEAELQSFLDDPCPPDMLGINHYITSERFLDERVSRYPGQPVGGNGRERYVDVPAARVRSESVLGPGGLFREIWERYHHPFVVTEVQLACTREEQLRWLLEFWRSAHAVRAEGIDLRAITVWGLFGAYDWDSLLLRPHGHYETGAFDVRGVKPRATATAQAIRHLIQHGQFDHPVLSNAGWWRRPVRFEFPASSAAATGANPDHPLQTSAVQGGPPLLIVGAKGRISQALTDLCRLRGLPVEIHDWHMWHAAHAGDWDAAFQQLGAWAVIDASAETELDRLDLEGSAEPERYHGSAALALAAAARKLPLVAFSTDAVFGGTATRSWIESDCPAPAHPYGVRHYDRERSLLQAHAGLLLLRTGPLFSSANDGDFVSAALQTLEAGRSITAPRDVIVSPTFLPDLLNAALDLLIDGESGIWHVANTGAPTLAEWARAIALTAGYRSPRVREISLESLPQPTVRAGRHSLDSARGPLLRPWPDALDRCLQEIEANRQRRLQQVA